MAYVNNPALGYISGSFGNLVCKTRKGKTYLATKPFQYTTPMDERSVFNRNLFGFCTKLSSALGKVFWFKYIWNNSSIEGPSHINKGITLNYPLIKRDGNLDHIFLIPYEKGFKGFPVNDLAITWENGFVRLQFQLPEDEKMYEIKKTPWVSAQGIIYLSEGSNSIRNVINFISVVDKDQPLLFNTPYTFDLQLSGNDRALAKEYRTKTVILNLLLKDISGIPLDASANLYETFVDESVIPLSSAAVQETAGQASLEETPAELVPSAESFV